MHAAIRMSDHQRLQKRIMELARALHDEQARTARLRAELAAAMLPYTGHRTHVVDGVLTIVLNSGEQYQRVQRVIDRPGESGFEWHFQRLDPVPDSPAARLVAVLEEPPRDGMTVADEDDAMPVSLVRALEASL
jgi:hypothetical protein